MIGQLTAWLRARDYARAERVAVRVLVPLALVASIVISLILLTLPSKLPGAALGSSWLLRSLWVLTIFYGFLLLLLPLVRSLRGQLPIELSLQGPRYEETTAAAAKGLRELGDDVQNQKALAAQLTQALRQAAERIAVLEDRVGLSKSPTPPGDQE
jgi:hypothetical protein